MWEILAAISAAIVSITTGTVLNAVKRSREMHDAVLIIKTEIVSLHKNVNTNLIDAKERTAELNQKMCELCSRMQRIEDDFREHLIFSQIQKNQYNSDNKENRYKM